ncbi:hypothetical protein E4U16_006998 [Claviceps sp. LM84 group G4]|nr:hypothetical protein E4U16_006998 [Claviceps sp. LM84 group G4]
MEATASASRAAEDTLVNNRRPSKRRLEQLDEQDVDGRDDGPIHVPLARRTRNLVHDWLSCITKGSCTFSDS